MIEHPVPVDLTDAVAQALRDLDQTDAYAPAMFVLRDGAPTWVVVSCESVIANVPAAIVEADGAGGYRAAVQ